MEVRKQLPLKQSVSQANQELQSGQGGLVDGVYVGGGQGFGQFGGGLFLNLMVVSFLLLLRLAYISSSSLDFGILCLSFC